MIPRYLLPAKDRRGARYSVPPRPCVRVAAAAISSACSAGQPRWVQRSRTLVKTTSVCAELTAPVGLPRSYATGPVYLGSPGLRTLDCRVLTPQPSLAAPFGLPRSYATGPVYLGSPALQQPTYLASYISAGTSFSSWARCKWGAVEEAQFPQCCSRIAGAISPSPPPDGAIGLRIIPGGAGHSTGYS